jgi:hypothetical protein
MLKRCWSWHDGWISGVGNKTAIDWNRLPLNVIGPLDRWVANDYDALLAA